MQHVILNSASPVGAGGRACPGRACRTFPKAAALILCLALPIAVSANIHYVSKTGSDFSPYDTPGTAASNIQDAVYAAEFGDTVLVDDGTYEPATEISITDGITLVSVNGSALTTIDGQDATRCLFMSNSAAVVDGFTVTGGNAADNGGGIRCEGGTVRNCIIIGNRTSGGSFDGGGVYCLSGGLVQDCVIYGNTSADDGGGVQCGNNGVPGGAVRNCLVYDNTATDAGGGVFCWPGGLAESCTIVTNFAARGGGIGCRDGGTFLNSIIYFNTATTLGQNWWEHATDDIDSSYCAVTPDPIGVGNTVADPMFVNRGALDFHLEKLSPCVDSGSNQTWMSVATDLDGDLRVTLSTVDMGAFEYPWPEIASVPAFAETDPVTHGGDSADDPAIWLHPGNASLSLIIGTDKTAGGGLGTYNLDGSTHSTYLGLSMNNVDTRYNFPLSGRWVDIVSAGSPQNSTLCIWVVDPATRTLSNAVARTITLVGPGSNLNEVYGYCMYRSGVSGEYYIFVNDAAGNVEQWELFDDGGDKIDAVRVREFAVGGKTEGMVTDDEYGYLYISQEDTALWRYGAEPGDDTSRIQIEVSSMTDGPLLPDIEGLAIYYAADGQGYLIASCQGDNAPPNPYQSTFAVFDRITGASIRNFKVVASNGVDEVTTADGVDVINLPMGPDFPVGMFVCHDDSNPGYNQNFKMVSWQDIATIGRTNLLMDTEWDPRAASMPAGYHMIATLSDANGTIEPAGVVWVEDGSNATFNLTGNLHYKLSDILLNGVPVGPANPFTSVNVTNRQTIEALFELEEHELVVISPYGGTTPQVGTNVFDWNTVVPCNVTNEYAYGGVQATQYVCVGWTGSGSVAGGMGTSTSVRLTEDSVITWQWRTNFYLQTATAGSGTVDVASDWCEDGTSVMMMAYSDSNYHFDSWTGDTGGCLIVADVIFAPMTQPRSITANFLIDTHTLTVSSSRGFGEPADGLYVYDYGSEVSCAVTNAVVTMGGTQQICSGWIGSGSVINGSGTNSGLFTLSEDSAIVWQWQNYRYWLNTGTSGAGSVSVADAWYGVGANVVITAGPAANHHFTAWSGDINGCTIGGAAIIVPMTTPRLIVANFEIDPQTLTVVSPFGEGQPPIGTNTYGYGDLVSCGITNSPITEGTTQRVCAGWVGTGNCPSEGTGTNTGPFSLIENSVVFWQWGDRHWLDTGTNGPGSVDVVDSWVDQDASVVISATAAPTYEFSAWSGDIGGCTLLGATIVVPMSRPRSIIAGFVDVTGPMGTPSWWLTSYGLTSNLVAVEELRDEDGDGMAAWEEWIARTDPTNELSCLTITAITEVSDDEVITWSTVAGRHYVVESCTNLWGFWTEVPEAAYTNIAAIGSTLSYTNSRAAPRYFRIRVLDE